MKMLWAILAVAILADPASAAVKRKHSRTKTPTKQQQQQQQKQPPQQQQQQKDQPFDGKPAVVLQVVDLSGPTPKAANGNTLFIGKKQNQLCWVSFNMPLKGNAMVAEAIYAPQPLELRSAGSQVSATSDKKNYTIVTQMNNLNNQNISRCWNFNESDPAGSYRLEVQINDRVFKGLAFEIVK